MNAKSIDHAVPEIETTIASLRAKVEIIRQSSEVAKALGRCPAGVIVLLKRGGDKE